LVSRILADMPVERDRVKVEGDVKQVAAFDAVLLTLAVRNLVENALCHSEGPVVVRIEGRSRTDIVVEDQGPGIPADELPHVTDRFFRGRQRSSTGSGLGLAIAQEAIARMGGVLSIRNRNPHGLA